MLRWTLSRNHPRRTFRPLQGVESVNNLLNISFARLQLHRGELRLVGRVGPRLTLDSHAIVVAVATATLGCGCTLQPVARIDLYSGLRRQHLHLAAACLAAQTTHAAKNILLPAVNYPAVVVTSDLLHKVEVRIDTLGKSLCRSEIHRCTLNLVGFARRNLYCVVGQELRAVELQVVVD